MMVIMAEDCCAFAAIAARNVNTKLKLTPPNKAIIRNFNPEVNGLSSNNVNARKLNKLISRTMMLLKMILDTINSLALTMEK